MKRIITVLIASIIVLGMSAVMASADEPMKMDDQPGVVIPPDADHADHPARPCNGDNSGPYRSEDCPPVVQPPVVVPPVQPPVVQPPVVNTPTPTPVAVPVAAPAATPAPTTVVKAVTAKKKAAVKKKAKASKKRATARKRATKKARKRAAHGPQFTG